MPAIYQLVPGSIIARLWFNSLFPPETYKPSDDVFSNLMVISTSLAMGTILGFAVVRAGNSMILYLCCCGCGRPCESPEARKRRKEEQARKADMSAAELQEMEDEEKKKKSDRQARFEGMYTAPHDDPRDANDAQEDVIIARKNI